MMYASEDHNMFQVL